MSGKAGPRKLLIASVGVATINYALGCEGAPGGGPTSANLMAPLSGAPPIAGMPPTSGNLPVPVGGLGGRDDVPRPGEQGGTGGSITGGAAGEQSSGGAGGEQPNGGAAGEGSGGDSAGGNGGAP